MVRQEDPEGPPKVEFPKVPKVLEKELWQRDLCGSRWQ